MSASGQATPICASNIAHVCQPFEEGFQFATWNVNGLLNKVENDWVSTISGYDIICLQETWCISPVHVEGYSSHFLAALGSQARRAKGGLQILISNKISTNVKKVALVGPHAQLYAQLLWLNKKGGKDLIVVNFYNNIFDSTRSSVVTALDRGLETFLASINTNFALVWAGDFKHPGMWSIYHPGMRPYLPGWRGKRPFLP